MDLRRLGEEAGRIRPRTAETARTTPSRASATALPFARWRSSTAQRGSRQRVLAAAAKLEPGPVRDLFEGYLPPDPKGRKLGSNPRPATILALTGDAKNGEALFFNKDMKCANCHKVGDKGTVARPGPHDDRQDPHAGRIARKPAPAVRDGSNRSSRRTSSARRTRRPSPGCS